MRTISSKKARTDAGTLRPTYDFSRGVTAAHYAQGTDVVLLDPDVAEVFPNAQAVNAALRTHARITRIPARGKARQKRTA